MEWYIGFGIGVVVFALIAVFVLPRVVKWFRSLNEG